MGGGRTPGPGYPSVMTEPADRAVADTSDDVANEEMSSRHVLYLLVAGGMFVLDAILIGATALLSPLGAGLLGVVLLVGIVQALRSWRAGPWEPLGWSILVAVVWVVVVIVGMTAWDWRQG